MSLSPSDYFTQGERKMSELTTDGTTKKYDDAAILFQKAGTQFSKARNFLRAGESYRRATDCMLHSKQLDQAANFAIESGKNYAKAKGGSEKAFEAFNIALQMYEQLNKTVLANKLTIEAAKIFESNKEYDKSIHYHELAVQSYKAQNKTQDFLREKKAICTLLILSNKWKDAATIYEQLFVDLSSQGIEKNAIEYGVFCILCHLANHDTVTTRATNDKYGTINKIWSSSEESQFLKDLVMQLVAKNVAQVQSICKQFNDKFKYGTTFDHIVKSLMSTYKGDAILQ